MFWNKQKVSDLYSGERETGTTLLDIHKHSVFRYNFVREILGKYTNYSNFIGLDIFCGNGYGAYFLAKYTNLLSITGIDGCKDAIKQAKKYYKSKKNKYKYKIFPFSLPKDKFDFVVCFESIEHIDDGNLLLKEIYKSLKNDSILFLSTPNKEFFPSSEKNDMFHKKIYSTTELESLLCSNNFEILEKYGQNVFNIDNNGKIIGYLPREKRNISPNINSQHIIYVCKKEHNRLN